ncbi:Predicted N-formylglutamate amidohydrolase [Albimonas donghaensis]|uniref:Predicted N-formylglutamate amidohydrolase n=1 Tax=Albimonas donghaensis TaxID=356660 RepID=A0A1H2XCR0_9RHOB|nr:N-formylglutamate amidohydrolase [Albimonas donghaensis]SDW90722.1 Predicted N-formylglutamate amidohydrolase [Albimonas donghaensis]
MPSMQACEIVAPDADPTILLLCDHAANTVPAEINGGDLGLPPEDMARHIAYDVGARAVTLALAERLGCPAVLSTFSRLVIDPNRGEDDPTLVMRLNDGSVIPANRHAGPDEVARRLADWHRPYHDAIRGIIDRAEARGVRPVLISMHSFTPQFRGRPPRPWHVSVLWDRDERLPAPLLGLLREEGDLVVGDNEPYLGALDGDTMNVHGTRRGLMHALIEIRNDLIASPEGQAVWAERLAPILRNAVELALDRDREGA